MEKINGQDLLNKLVDVEKRLINVEYKIKKRFDLILDKYRTYLTEEDKTYLTKTFTHDISIRRRLDIIIRTEDNYNKINGNQMTIDFK